MAFITLLSSIFVQILGSKVSPILCSIANMTVRCSWLDLGVYVLERPLTLFTRVGGDFISSSIEFM